MIRAHVGTPGGGKTYETVKVIIENLKRGRKVYTNVEGMDDPKKREMIKHLVGLGEGEIDDLLIFMANPWDKIRTDYPQVKVFWEFVEPGSMIVIDEVHKIWSSRTYASESNKAFADWCSTHRHYGHDMILITQSLEKLDGHVRSLVEWTYRYKKIGFMGSLVRNSYMEYAYSEDNERNYLSRKTKGYKKTIFHCYKSFAGKEIKEQKLAKTANIFRHPVFFALPLVLGIAVYMLFFKSSIAQGDLFGSKKVMELATQKRAEQSKAVSLDKEEGKGYWQNGKWVQMKTDDKKPVSSAAVADAEQQEQRPARIGANSGHVRATGVNVEKKHDAEKVLIAIVDGKRCYDVGGKLQCED